MPTGYTADIKDGIDFKTYAMNCARAFGACVMLRDEPGGGERIPDAFEPSDLFVRYHLKAVEKARVELAALDAMTPAECERAAAKAWDDAETSRLMRLEDCRKSCAPPMKRCCRRCRHGCRRPLTMPACTSSCGHRSSRASISTATRTIYLC